MARDDLQNTIHKILSLYKAWTKAIPSNDISTFVQMQKFIDPANEVNTVDEGMSERSSVTRAERSTWRKKRGPNNAEEPRELLDRGTLLVLNALVPHDTTKYDSISRWLADIPNAFDVDPVSNIPLS